jgi:pimeloyl-ACP methyl ester carboxylesterase
MILISPTGIGTSKNLPISSDKWMQRMLDFPIIGTSAYNMLSSKINLRKFLTHNIYSYNYTVTNELIDEYYAAAHFGGPTAKYSAATFLSNFLSIDVERLFQNINIPVHILWGEDNTLNPVENIDVLKKINPEIKVTVFKNTKVLPHSESHKAFNNLCREFFD